MDITFVGIIAGIAIIVLVALFILLKLSWKVAEPNEALIVTGLGARSVAADGAGLGFKIIVGRG
ncbi:MAG TPA: flotillin family protein, partial [Candidatus Nanopelagicales bacterium]|nr:flotillin family protein [Candidatus Nanopelagicales bacterium]